MHRLTATLTAFSAILVAASDDPRPSFAVASIKPSAAPVKFEHDGRIETSPGGLRMQDVTVSSCIKWAYGVQDSQIAGLEPRDSPHYDVIAKADTPVPEAHMKVMMQSLLAERFKLTFHRQSRELSAYALTVAKNGPKFREAIDDAKGTIRNSQAGFIAKSVTMREFADFISGPLSAPVVDATGLTAKYDFSVDFTSYLPTDLEPGKRPDTIGIVLTAMQGELGLKFESRKMPVEVMVVDHVEKPSEN